MSAQPTVGELVTSAQAILSSLTEEQARNFIKANNIRSNSKLTTLVTELATKTSEEIMTATQATTTTKAKKSSSVAKKAAAAKKPAAKKFARKPKGERTTKIVEAGPRGFRFGPVWNDSVKAGEGVAMIDANRNKLIAHAESVGVHAGTIASGDAAKIAKAIAAKLD